MIYNQYIIENEDLFDPGTEMEHDNVHNTEEFQNNTKTNITNVISETKQDDEVLEGKLI